eukprot:TRINITY_DN833_c0_g1_i4.p1 TRINITY_DN833_c0_g1~~TRINITY_DN833_c0_g1_i4.p1  ORF type:complete len:265 (+),score=68.89 TRINITY_DN833_c0_g1_i4:62-856(+)
MPPARVCSAFGAGSAAMALLGASAFTASPNSGSSQQLRHSQHGAAALPAPASTTSGTTIAVGASSMLALGAVAAHSRRSQKTASRAILTKDDAGLYRFDVPAKPLVIEEQPGVTAPLGFFDPLGFSKSGLMTFPGDPTGFKHLREAEIKHGRFAMMGSVGSAFAHYVKFPGFEQVPTGMKALDTELGAQGCAVLFCIVGFIEAANWKQNKGEPGSYGDPFNLNQFTPEMRTRELNNGRMAMFAMMGQLVAEAQTGLDPIDQFAF